MASVATLTPVVKKPAAWKRYIDEVAAFLKKEAPVLGQVAEAARPIAALTPFGPEYNLVVTSIETAVQADIATQAASAAPLTGVQKLALAVQVSTPGLTSILASKGIHENPVQAAAIAQFVQNVYDLHTLPVAAVVPAAAK